MRISAVFLCLASLAAQAQEDYSSQDSSAAVGVLIWIFFWGIVGGLVGAAIGSRKGVGVGGFFLGMLLGPIGWIIIAVIKGDRISCPLCRELIDPQAMVCPKCHGTLVKRAVAYEQMINHPFSPKEEMEPRTSPKFSRTTRFDIPKKEPPPPPRRAVNNLVRVARDGEDLGPLSAVQICEMIGAGQLTLEDHFFDPELNQWQTLDRCPTISIEGRS